MSVQYKLPVIRIESLYKYPLSVPAVPESLMRSAARIVPDKNRSPYRLVTSDIDKIP